jgi:hypothetical protein
VYEHFWVVPSDPEKDSARVAIVNFTSYSADKHQACIVIVGDHPWVWKKTLRELSRGEIPLCRGILEIENSRTHPKSGANLTSTA